MKRALVTAALCGLLYLVLGIWTTRPLVLHFDSALSYGTQPEIEAPLNFVPSDAAQLVFYNWNFVQNVRNLRSPIANVYEFGSLNPDDIHALGLWGFPLQLFFLVLSPLGWVLAYNLLVLFSYSASGLAQFFLLRVLKCDRRFAFLGGLFYALCFPRNIQLASGHANAFLYFTLPLFLGLLVLALRDTNKRAAVGAALTLIATAVGEWHLFYYTSFLCLVYGGWLVRQCGVLERLRVSSTWLVLGIIAAGEALGVGYVLSLVTVGMAGSISEGGRSLNEAMLYAPKAIDLVSRSVFDGGLRFQGSDLERGVYLGWALLLSVTIGVLGAAFTPFRRAEGRGLRGWAAGHLLFAALFALLSLGPNTFLYTWLFDFMPYWSYSRVSGRIIFITQCLLGSGACLLLCDLARSAEARGGGPKQLVAWGYPLLVLIVIVDLVLYSVPWALSHYPREAEIPHTVRSLNLEPSESVLYLPIYSPGMTQNAAYEAYTTHFGYPFINGYSPAAPATAVRVSKLLGPLQKGLITPSTIALLHRLRVRYLIHTRGTHFMPPSGLRLGRLVNALDNHPSFSVVYRDRNWLVWELSEH